MFGCANFIRLVLMDFYRVLFVSWYLFSIINFSLILEIVYQIEHTMKLFNDIVSHANNDTQG